tara:strand:+ start:94 stop:438 length:345 start_codon:yes stop_codon:yes gene_type:complete
MNKAVLIDPYVGEITDVVVGDWKDIQKLLQCDCFGSGGYTETNDAIYVNDEGLYTETMYVKIPDLYPDPYAGRVLILGMDDDGDSADSNMSAKDVKKMEHEFLNSSQVKALYAY